MKRKYNDRQIASMEKKLAAAHKIVRSIENQISSELNRISDRMCDLECANSEKQLNEKRQQEYKVLNRYENKLLRLA